MKNCAYDYEATDSIHDSFVGSPQREGRSCRGRPSHAGRVGDQALAKKIRRLYNDKILAGFAGSTADAFTLFSRFEAKLEQYHGNLGRAAVELARDWRTDKFLRHLEALLLVSDKEQTYLLSGQGDVIEPDGLITKPWDRTGERRGSDTLEKLSDLTGGLYFHVRNTDEAKEDAIKAGRALRNEYVIGYRPSDSGISGRWHRIRVKSKASDLHVHARNGYYSVEDRSRSLNGVMPQ